MGVKLTVSEMRPLRPRRATMADLPPMHFRCLSYLPVRKGLAAQKCGAGGYGLNLRV